MQSAFQIAQSIFQYGKIIRKKSNLLLGKKTINSRQKAQSFDINPSVIAWNRDGILKLKKVINKKSYFNFIPVERSLDIDTLYDFELAELIYKHKVKNENVFYKK